MITKKRILIADDETVILKYYQKLLSPTKKIEEEHFNKLEKDLFGDEEQADSFYEVVACSQGEEALELVEKSLIENDPFACALLDVRMPPGKGGVWAAEQIRKIDPDIHVAIITAYADTDIREISDRVPPADKLLFSVKPVHPQELIQLASALTSKWTAEKAVKKYKKRLSEKIEMQENSLIEMNKALVADMEKLKAIEQKLQKHSMVFNIIDEAVVVTDLTGIIQEVNPSFYSVFNIDYYVNSLRIKDFLNINDAIQEKIYAYIEKNKNWSGELPYLNKDGAKKWLKLSVKISENGNFTGYVYVISDITEEKKREQLINQQKKLLEEIFTRVGQGIVIVDENEIVLLANPAIGGIFETEPELMKGKNLLDFFSDEEKEKIYRQTEKRKNLEITKYEVQAVTESGSIKEIEITAYPRVDNNNFFIGSFAVVVDLTVNKAIMNKSALSQKMEAMGRLAGGIAHDFNNTLTIISTAMELMKAKYGNKMEENFLNISDEVLHSVDYAKDLVNQLLMFSRQRESEKKTINLNNIINDTERFLRRVLGSDISINLNLDEKIGNIYADIAQIKQILVNFAVNSRDAMPTGGNISISTKRVSFNKKEIFDAGELQEGEYVLLSFRDNGKGIDESTIKKVFEPFFTTKSEEKGTGLGLAIAFSVVQEHKGIISVESKVGVGTIFSIYLPVIDGSVDEITHEEMNMEDVHPATILFVEDDQFVRKFTSSILRHYDFKVYEAETMKTAREIFRIHLQEIEILLTDVFLSDGSGILLTDELALKKEDLRCYLMSGYSINDKQVSLIKNKGIPFLKKPYTIKELISFLNHERAFTIKEGDKCELIEQCGFFNNFQGEERSTLMNGWMKMFCDKIEKSQRCERKKIFFKTGTEPNQKLTPTGKLMDIDKIDFN